MLCTLFHHPVSSTVFQADALGFAQWIDQSFPPVSRHAESVNDEGCSESDYSMLNSGLLTENVCV